MKTTLIALIVLIIGVSCGKKTTGSLSHVSTDATLPPGCDDTLSDITFVNSKTVELRVNISDKTVIRQGNTIINNWKTFKVIPIPAGDSTTIRLRSGKQFMYSVMGPVSVNVNGMGVVAEEKFTLEPCKKQRTVL